MGFENFKNVADSKPKAGEASLWMNRLKIKNFPIRYIIIILSAFTIAMQYTIRTSLSFAIVAMVNESAFDKTSINVGILESHTNNSKKCGCHKNGQNLTEGVIRQFLFILQKNESKIDESNVKKETPTFDWSPTTQGHILGAFYYGYIFSSTNGGQLADLFGGRWLIGNTILIASVLSLLTPIAAYYSSFLVILIRAILGLVQGVQTPALYTIFGYWVPKHERGRALASLFVGGNVGSVIIMPLSAYLCHNYDWSLVFYTVGVAGFFTYILWLVFIRDKPVQHPMIQETEILYIKSNLENGGEKKNVVQVPWKSLIISTQTWVIILAKFTGFWGYITLTFKLPSYLESVMHVSLEKNGLINSLVYIAISISMIFFGYLSDLIEERQLLKKKCSRKLFESIALFGPAVCLILIPVFGCDYAVLVTLLILSMVLYGALAGGDNPIVMDIAPDYSGSLYGFTNCIASMPGFIAPVLIGLILEYDNSIKSWNYIFYFAAFIYIIGGVGFLLFASCKPEPWGLASKSCKDSQNEKPIGVKTIK